MLKKKKRDKSLNPRRVENEMLRWWWWVGILFLSFAIFNRERERERKKIKWKGLKKGLNDKLLRKKKNR